MVSRRTKRTISPPSASGGRYKAPKIELLPIRDFSGGLNYNADAFQLQEGESPDMLNVDIDPRGGFGPRSGVGVLNTTQVGVMPRNIWDFNPSSQVLVQIDDDAAYSTGAGFTTINPDALTMSGTGKMRAATFNNLCYIQRNAEQVAFKWDGAAATALGTTFNDNIAAPDNGDMVKGKCIASHRGYLWVANTVTAAGTKKNRVHWSHPNNPEDWRTLDFIDIDDGVDGDEIVALMPYKDRLLVFKQQTCHAITGYSPETFSVATVSNEVGAISQEAVSASESSVYFFSWPDGVMRYDGAKITWLFERLSPAIKSGTIPSSAQAKIVLAWMGRRLWVSVPFGVAASDNTRVFVWDPSLSKTGSWVAYDLKLGPMLDWQPMASGSTLLALSAISGNKRVFKLQQGTLTDTFDGSATVQVPTYYYTRWFDPTQPEQRKRWRRPEFVIDADASVTLQVDVFKDYDPTVILRTFTISNTALPVSMLWDTDNWDAKPWSADASTGRQKLVRGLGIGSARTVQLKFTGPATSAAWGVNSIGFKFLPKRVR